MIQINDISKVFRTSEVETVALNHVSLDIEEGEFVAIMGPSGCGKSTLLNILGLLDNPTEGSYQLMGQEVATLQEKERTRVRKGKLGFVFQSFNLIWSRIERIARIVSVCTPSGRKKQASTPSITVSIRNRRISSFSFSARSGEILWS